MAGLSLGWKGQGVVADVRPLGKKADKTDIWAYSVKLQCLGGTFELNTTDKRIADQCHVGTTVDVSGNFSEFAGKLKLDLRTVAEVAEPPVGVKATPGAVAK